MIIEEYQKVLEENYLINLEEFSKYMPELHKKLTTESNSAYSLELTHNNLNIAKNGEMVYPYDDVLGYFQQFLESYHQRGKLNLIPFRINYMENDTSLETHGIETISFKHYASLAQNYKRIFKKSPDVSKLNPYHDEIYSMVVFGIGLGYHIPEIIQKYNITHLVLIEEDIEMLRASLYTLNWKEIFEYFVEKNKFRNIEIMIESESGQIEKNLFYMLNKNLPMTYYNMGQMVTYQNELFTDVLRNFTKHVELYTGSSQGFYDDEKWSLQHTIHNLHEKIPTYANNNVFVPKDKPVFVIGNGPSLDSYMEFIKENQDKVIIIAAGSAVGALYKADIRIDIILQIERTIETYNLLIDSAPKEYLRKKLFVGMNTIHPRVYDLFDKKAMFLKYADAGSEFIDDSRFPHLAFTNPTATNGAFRMALQFGFKNISFFGLDFGFKSLENHHSKYSSYYDDDSKVNYNTKDKEFFQVKGNDGSPVYTDYIYNGSRKSIEKLAALALQEKEDNIKIYNYSKGAFIENTIIANIEDGYLNKFESITEDTREDILENIQKQFVCIDKDFTPDELKDMNERFDSFKSFIGMFKRSNINAYMFLKFSSVIYSTFSNSFTPYTYVHRMIKGSFLNLMTKIYVYSAFQKQDKKTEEFLNDSLDTLINYIDDIQNDINSINNVIDRPF